MKVLVTGGAGFIGSHFTRSLLRRGDQVVIVDDLNDFYDPALKRRNLEELKNDGDYRFEELDIRNAEGMARVFEENKPDAVVHLAARAGVRPSLDNPILYEEVNVVGTLHLLDLARKYDVKNFVFGSSSSVYGINKKVPFAETDPIESTISLYAATKRSGELYVYNYSHLYNLPSTCLRFFTVYGPGQRPDLAIHNFTRRILAGEKIDVFGDGTSSRDYTHVSDIVSGMLAALDKPQDFAIYNLGNSVPVSLNDLISTIEDATGVKAKRRPMPLQPGDVPVTYADIRAAATDLGYEPKVKLRDGIFDFVDWYRNVFV